MFLIRSINRPLHIQDINVLLSLRFFLRDMYDQLKIDCNQTFLVIDLIVCRN